MQIRLDYPLPNMPKNCVERTRRGYFALGQKFAHQPIPTPASTVEDMCVGFLINDLSRPVDTKKIVPVGARVAIAIYDPFVVRKAGRSGFENRLDLFLGRKPPATAV